MSVLLLLLLAQTTIEGDELLKSPIKGDFAVAKEAPKVDITIIPDLPTGDRQTLWSSWGDGVVASNGKYYTAIGDHRGKDATSRVYEVDPATNSLKLLVDVAKAIGQKAGAYGHGKIHAALHEHEGALWFATYWGKPRELDFTGEYQGSILLRYDLKSGAVENLGAIAPKRGLPASNFDPERELLYFHAVSKDEDGGADELLVYDLKARAVRFTGGGDILDGKRAFLRDRAGRMYLSTKDGTLACYDPEKNALASTKAKLPESSGGRRGSELRAGARAAKDGVLYGMTGAGRLFSFDPAAQAVNDLGANFGDGDYTAVMVLSPDERRLYFVPGAHGSSSRLGTPVVQVDAATGKRKVIAFLNEPVRGKLKHNLGGTYNLQIDPAGERLFITFNGAPWDPAARKAEAFGQPSVVVVHIPASER